LAKTSPHEVGEEPSPTKTHPPVGAERPLGKVIAVVVVVVVVVVFVVVVEYY
jgi:hypothetical protein